MIRIFNHYVHSSYIVLLTVESVIFLFAIYAAASLRFFSLDEAVVRLGPLWPRAVIFFFVFISSMTVLGMYDRNSRANIKYLIQYASFAFVLGFVLMSMIFYMFPGLIIGRGVLLIAIVVSFVAVVSVRIIFNKYYGLNNHHHRVLVLGAGKKAAALEKMMRRKVDRRGIELVGYVSMGGEAVFVKSKPLGANSSIKDIVLQNNIEIIVLAVDERRHLLPINELVDCRMGGVTVIEYVSFVEMRACKLMVRDVDPSWLMYSEGFGRSVLNGILKRIFDIAVSNIFIVLFSPVVMVSVMLMFLEDGCRGGIVYKQQRVGLNGRIYTIYKLRSMREGAEKPGSPCWAGENDERITRVGRYLRKYRIDELPQLVNVIKGDMSFVGPRPERPEFVHGLTRDIPYFSDRHRVKPGITGWAQICYPYGASTEDAIAKLEYDLYYVKHCNLFLDLVVLFQTAQVVLFGKGAR